MLSVRNRTGIAPLPTSPLDYQPSTLASALKQLPLTELQGRKGSVYVSSAVMLWGKAARRLINLDTSGAVKEVAVAIRGGLAQAIAERQQSQ